MADRYRVVDHVGGWFVVWDDKRGQDACTRDDKPSAIDEAARLNAAERKRDAADAMHKSLNSIVFNLKGLRNTNFGREDLLGYIETAVLTARAALRLADGGSDE